MQNRKKEKRDNPRVHFLFFYENEKPKTERSGRWTVNTLKLQRQISRATFESKYGILILRDTGNRWRKTKEQKPWNKAEQILPWAGLFEAGLR